MNSSRINRRALLTAFGAAGASALLPSLLNGNGSSARAEELTPPKRLVLIGTWHGTVHDQFDLRPMGMPEEIVQGTDWQMSLTDRKPATMKSGGLDPTGQSWPSGWEVEDVGDFSRILAPLSPFASKMLILDGLSMLVSIMGASDACPHSKGGISRWTGNLMRTIDQGVFGAYGPSLDKMIAKKIARPDRIPSLEIGESWDFKSRFDENGNALPVEMSPVALHKRLFPSIDNASGTNPLDLAQSSILDFVRNEYNVLAPRLSSEDRKKLEQHRDMVRDLEKRIAGLAAAQCEPVPAPVALPDNTINERRYRYETFMELVTMAFACDLTRVASIVLPGFEGVDFDGPAANVHGDFAHHADDAPVPNDLAHEMMTRYHTMNLTVVAKLCSLLDTIPDGDGTLLDSTIIAICTDMGNGGHVLHNYPVILVGGGGKSLATGRYLHYAQNLTPYGGWSDFQKRAGIPHNKLLTTIGRIFGLETNFTGIESAPIIGQNIDCSGILNELLA
jgi:Protein of unknown function (DUF1552)